MKNNLIVIVIIFLGFIFCSRFIYAEEKIDFSSQKQFKINIDEIKKAFKEVTKPYGDPFRIFPTKDDLTLHMDALKDSISTLKWILGGIGAALMAIFMYMLKSLDSIRKDIRNIFIDRLSKLEIRLDERNQ